MPSPRPNHVMLGNAASSSSFLQQLLDEINGRTTPARIHKASTPLDATESQLDSRRSRERTPSVWVGGAPDAQDARERLGSADEARLFKTYTDGINITPHSRKECPRISTSPTSPSPSLSTRSMSEPNYQESLFLEPALESTPKHIARTTVFGRQICPLLPHVARRSCHLRSSSNKQLTWLRRDFDIQDFPFGFCDMTSDRSANPLWNETPASPTTATSTEATTAMEDHASHHITQRDCCLKRTHSFEVPAGMRTKRTRIIAFPESPSRIINPFEAQNSSSADSVNNHGILFQHRTPFEAPAISPEPVSPVVSEDAPPVPTNQPTTASPEDLFRPSTPILDSGRRLSMPEWDVNFPRGETPSFARSLHLIDSHVSVYKCDHGEEWEEKALCMHCFRRHGSFNRILLHGYEVCGGEEKLGGHYWEPALDP